MGGSWLLVLAWSFVCAAQSPVDHRGVPECVRCYAENRRLAGTIEQLQARVDQLEAELVTQRATGRGACATARSTTFRCEVNDLLIDDWRLLIVAAQWQ